MVNTDIFSGLHSRTQKDSSLSESESDDDDEE